MFMVLSSLLGVLGINYRFVGYRSYLVLLPNALDALDALDAFDANASVVARPSPVTPMLTRGLPNSSACLRTKHDACLSRLL